MTVRRIACGRERKNARRKRAYLIAKNGQKPRV
jgi:hypothetical protein